MSVQFLFTVIVGLYFFRLLKSQQSTKGIIEKESEKELQKLERLRSIHLTEPLSEKTRPTVLEEVIGQESGIKALKAALCGPNPQHIIIYGPPGVGKTTAARIILEVAKKMSVSPFMAQSKFIEMDATTLRFDERGIADPLIGSVHDPIYQGAGAYGVAGVPQPKPGAVTKAHGGVLFLDEIGELHPIQLNKLLKVLEDRKVFLESSYYSTENKSIPMHIHDIFQNGLPADFRLVGATTRSPEEIPVALRSRCTEIFFRNLHSDEIRMIVNNGSKKGGFTIEDGVSHFIAQYATNGREAVKILQTAGSIAIMEERKEIKVKDVEWVIDLGNYSPNISKKVQEDSMVGVVNGLGVCGIHQGAILEIEVISIPAKEKGKGTLSITGIIEEEEINNGNRKVRRGSTSRASIQNVLTVITTITDIDHRDYNIHVNIPGGIPVDGPSAGIAIFTAVYSSLLKQAVSNKTAMTGEISIRGKVLPVGGVPAKVTAAKESGITKVFIPQANWKESYEDYPITVIPVTTIHEVLKEVFQEEKYVDPAQQSSILSAQSAI